MTAPDDHRWRRLAGWMIGSTIVLAAVGVGYYVMRVNYLAPRTDDAVVIANVVGIAPRVTGEILELKVVDNQKVEQGDLLFTLDARPFEAVRARAEAALLLARSELEAMSNSIASAQTAVTARQTEWELASSELKRDEPLLQSQAIAAVDVDIARTKVRTTAARLEEARQTLSQQKNLLGQFGTLNARISSAESDLRAAQLNVEYCRVVAPFQGRVVNLTISAGQLAREGQSLFTLVDTRHWYVTANFRETMIPNIHQGADVNVYLMAYPRRLFRGTVQDVGWAIQSPDASANGLLPQVQPALNWVRLAQRLPVRIELEPPDPNYPYHMGMTAVVTVRGQAQPVTRANTPASQHSP